MYSGVLARVLDITQEASFEKAKWWVEQLQENEPVSKLVPFAIVTASSLKVYLFICWRLSRYKSLQVENSCSLLSLAIT